MYTYKAFGVDIESDLVLPELRPGRATGRPPVSIRLGPVDTFTSNVEGTAHRAGRNQMLFSYDTVGRFRVSDGCQILIDLDTAADVDLLRVCLLGPVLAALLHQRELLVLHASAVTLGDTASAFLGGKGWGKSTLAGVLRDRGHRLLADDVVAIDMSGPAPLVYPGFPQLKLWPAAAEVLGLDPAGLPRLQQNLEKRAFHCEDRFQTCPVPLGPIYVLDVGDRIAVERLDRREAFAELVRHTYFAKYLGAAGTSVAHFGQCAEVVKSVPVFSLVRPAKLELLGETAAAVESSGTRWSLPTS